MLRLRDMAIARKRADANAKGEMLRYLSNAKTETVLMLSNMLNTKGCG